MAGIGLSLILGGAIGNLWDRVVSGRVVDFLFFYIGQYQWPAFNLADSAIVVGAGHNGLACAAYLAKAGKSVLVIESREHAASRGGRNDAGWGFRLPLTLYMSAYLLAVVSFDRKSRNQI